MSSDTLTLTPINADGSLWTAQAITVNRPIHGYEAEVHLPIESVKSHIGDWHFFDNDATGASDYRAGSMSFELPAAQQSALNRFIRAYGITLSGTGIGARCLPFQLSWSAEQGALGAGDPGDGFYPFGPDLCANPCVVQLFSQDQGGALWQPWKYFENKLKLVYIPASRYSTAWTNQPAGGLENVGATPTPGPAQGSMALGGASGLMFPQDAFKPKSIYAQEIGLSLAGQPGVIDGVTDQYETSFTLTANLGNAAATVAALTGLRAGDITFSVKDGWPFGADNGESGSFTVKLLGSSRTENEIVLKITHESYNRFAIPLNLYMKAVN